MTGKPTSSNSQDRTASARQRGIKRKQLIHRNDLEVHGDLQISDLLCVGGDLTVHGNLKASELYCLGQLKVTGDIQVSFLNVGLGIEAGGSIFSDYVEVSGSCFDAQEFDQLILERVAPRRVQEDGLYFLADDETASRCEERISESIVSVKGDFIVSGRVEINCAVTVGGLFNPDDAEVGGPLDAAQIYVEGDLWSVSCIDVTGDIVVDGDLLVSGWINSASVSAEKLVAGEIKTFHVAHGNITCSALEVEEDVSCSGTVIATEGIKVGRYLRAQGSIATRGTITTGKDFGILAGLGHPRSAWRQSGYVCAQSRPKNILSGEYAPLSKRLNRYEEPRPAKRVRREKPKPKPEKMAPLKRPVKT